MGRTFRSCTIDGNHWRQQNRLAVFRISASHVQIKSTYTVRLNRRPGNALQDSTHRVAHSGVEFAVLTGVLDKVLVKDDTTGFENHDRG